MRQWSGNSTLIAAMVALFLGAAVVANIIVGKWGQPALLVTAWILIPFELVTRDVLHERWGSRGVWLRMAILIVAGSALTAAVSWDTRTVAIASSLGFFAAGATNTSVYHTMRRRSRYMRMNVSNLAAASVDSVVFPLAAFGVSGTSAALCAAQAASKFIGGLLWSALFVKLIKEKEA